MLYQSVAALSFVAVVVLWGVFGAHLGGHLGPTGGSGGGSSSTVVTESGTLTTLARNESGNIIFQFEDTVFSASVVDRAATFVVSDSNSVNQTGVTSAIQIQSNPSEFPSLYPVAQALFNITIDDNGTDVPCTLQLNKANPPPSDVFSIAISPLVANFSGSGNLTIPPFTLQYVTA